MPGTSALVESASSRSTPSAPSRANPPRSVRRPSSGSWSILKSPVCRISPAGVLIATASASGMEWLTERNSRSQGPNRWLPAGLDLHVHRGDPVLGELAAHERERQPRADQRDVGPLAQQVRHGADVILVRVRQHERLDLVQPALEGGEVRQDQVDARLIGPRGTARRSRRRAAGPRTRRRSCCGRSRRGRRARPGAGRLAASGGGGPSSGCG